MRRRRGLAAFVPALALTALVDTAAVAAQSGAAPATDTGRDLGRAGRASVLPRRRLVTELQCATRGARPFAGHTGVPG